MTDQQLALAAFAGTSHVPERRAASALESLKAELDDGAAKILAMAKNDAQQTAAVDLVADWRAGYRKRWAAYMGARSRLMSPMITGPANFPTARNRKRGNTADKRGQELDSFRPWFMKKVGKRMAELRTFAEVEDAEAHYLKRIIVTQLDVVNRIKNRDPEWRGYDVSAFRNSAAGKIKRADPRAAARALKWLRDTAQTGYKHQLFASRNSIWKLLDEPAPEPAAARTGAGELATGDGWRIVSDYDADRVRIYFDKKPGPEIRTKLKAAAWRWSPTAGAWQRQLTANAERAALAIREAL